MALRFGGGHIEFYRSMANSAQAGLAPATALNILAKGSPGIPSETLRTIQQTIQRGETFSAALKAHPDEFPAWQIEMVRVGETTGRLDTIFLRIAEMLEERRSFLLNMMSSLAYPLFLVHIAPFILCAQSFITEGFDGYVSHVIHALLWLYVPGAAVFLAIRSGIWTLSRTPFLGIIMSKMQFCTFLASAMKAGVPFDRAVQISAAASGVAMDGKATRGESSALDHLRRLGIFSDDELARMEVAELSGKLDDDLQLIAGKTRETWRSTIKTISAVLPAIFMLGIGLIIAYRIINFYQGAITSSFQMPE